MTNRTARGTEEVSARRSDRETKEPDERRCLTSSVPPVRRSFTRLLTSSLRFGPSFIPVSLIPVGRAEPGPACGRASPTGMETERNEE